MDMNPQQYREMEEAQQAVLGRLTAEEMQRRDAERQRVEALRLARRAQMAQQEADAQRAAVSALSALQPLYAQRRALVEGRLADALSDLLQVERELGHGLRDALSGLAPMGSASNDSARRSEDQRLSALRTQAGLPPMHSRLGLRHPPADAGIALAAAVAKALSQGLIALGDDQRSVLVNANIIFHLVDGA